MDAATRLRYLNCSSSPTFHAHALTFFLPFALSALIVRATSATGRRASHIFLVCLGDCLPVFYVAYIAIGHFDQK
ncbi:hypothetical protein BJV77DRAFT_1026223 [Russula vinacea]|nr:hypothetical protein BJV77DRAFT_1026223 [Russula vinacea]